MLLGRATKSALEKGFIEKGTRDSLNEGAWKGILRSWMVTQCNLQMMSRVTLA